MKRLVFLVAAVCLISGCTQYRILPPPSWIIPSEPEASEIILSETELSLEKDQTYQLSATVNPPEASPELIWQSSNEDIITVDSDGVITAVATGEAAVTVLVADNPSINAVCSITVSDVVVDEGRTLADLLEEKGLNNATSLSIAGTLTDNDFTTLRGMTSLQHLDISDVSNTTIPQSAFYQASFSTIELPAGLKTIGQWAFEGSSITELDIPDGVTEIQNSAFMNCYKLEKLTIPGSVETVGRWILQSADGNTGVFPDDIETPEVIIEEGVKELSPSAFWGSAITSIKIPESITVIPDYCFAVSKLNTIEFHDGITRIGAEAFGNCTLSFENNTLAIPRDVEIIGPRAFAIDNSLNMDVELNEKLVYLYQEAFFTGFKIDALELPASLKYLSREAFSTRDGITYVVFNGTEPPKVIDYFNPYSYDFDGEKYSGLLAEPSIQSPAAYLNMVAYVPDESLEEYQKVWKQPEGKTNWPFKQENIKGISELNP